MSLRLLQSNAQTGLREALESIAKRDSNEQSGESYFLASFSYRCLGTCALLLQGDIPGYLNFMAMSGHARSFFLRSVQEGRHVESRYLCNSQNAPFMDAVSATDWSTAIEIARLSPQQHFPDIEYEEDHLFYAVAYALLLNLKEGAAVDTRAMLTRWQQVMRGAPDSRLPVCAAICEKDEARFNASMLSLVQQRKADYARWEKGSGYNDNVVMAGKSLFVSGVALVRLAKLAGLELTESLDTIPLPALAVLTVPLPPTNAWRSFTAS